MLSDPCFMFHAYTCYNAFNMENLKTTNRKELSAMWQEFFKTSEALVENEVDQSKKIHVIQSISSINLFYENVRNLLGYQQEQMLRRIAIERFLKRPFVLNLSQTETAENLVRELIYSGYLKNDSIDQATVTKITSALNRYRVLKEHFSRANIDFITGIESTEIESILSPREDNDKIIEIFYEIIHRHIKKMSVVAEGALFASLINVFEKADIATERYHLMKRQLPELFSSNDVIDGAMIEKTRHQITKINQELASKHYKKYLIIAKRYFPIYYCISQIVQKNKAKAEQIFSDPISIERHVTQIVSEYNNDFLLRLYRSVLKAIFFIFVTKMALGLLLEIPYDKYYIGHINFLPLFINLFIPPILMLLSSSLISIPGKSNMTRLSKLTQDLLYLPDDTNIEQLAYHRPDEHLTVTGSLMNFFYLLSFVVIFGGLILLLRALDFNPVSAILFFFFLSTVSFFAFRIRRGASELVVIDGHESAFAATIDFLLLPFLTIGYQISMRLDKANVFLFIFDFILEAPFKMVVQLAEQWIGFVRTKKDEMIS